MTIGDRIRARREELGMTQTDLANQVGESKQTIYKYENSVITNIPINKLEAIALILGVGPAELMGYNIKEDQPAGEFDELTEIEKVLLRVFRAVPEEKQEKLLTAIEAFVATLQ